MAKTKQMSELKRRALLAKQRLRMGYWQSMERRRQEMEESGAIDRRHASMMQRERFRRDELLATDESRARKEEQLYEKVCRILDADEYTLSPIGQLIDKEEYMRLDDAGRQRYVLELSARFRELSKRYYMERRARTR